MFGQLQVSVEDFATYAKRCAQMVREHLGTSVGAWTKLWIEGSFSWDDHLARDWSEQRRAFDEVSHREFATCFSLAASLSRYHASDWLAARRILTINESGRAHSRTNTRCIRGVVRPRYHDAISALRDSFPLPMNKWVFLR